MTTHSSPTTIAPSSAVSTAPCRMRLRGPTRTSPDSTAVGATVADGSTTGRWPRCSISMVAWAQRADAAAGAASDAVDVATGRLRRSTTTVIAAAVSAASTMCTPTASGGSPLRAW